MQTNGVTNAVTWSFFMIVSTHRWHLVTRFSAKKTVEPEQRPDR